MRIAIRRLEKRRIVYVIGFSLFIIFSCFYLLQSNNTTQQKHTDFQNPFAVENTNKFYMKPVKLPKYLYFGQNLQPFKGFEKNEAKNNAYSNEEIGIGVIEAPKSPANTQSITLEEVNGGEPHDQQTRHRRNFIKTMTRHAWKSYKQFAWGHNELKPLSRSFHDTAVLGEAPLGATIVDSLDTLYIMGLDAEFNDATDWLMNTFTLNWDTTISVFEYTIRFIGGLLSTFAMTGNELFLNKSIQVADKLLPAFGANFHLPHSLVNLKSGKSSNFKWVNGGCHILSEVGTLHMEFQFLSELSGKKIYSDLVHKIRKYINDIDRPNGLFYNYIHGTNKRFCSTHASLAGLGDSFYEYLLKEWIRTGGDDVESRVMYDSSIKAILEANMIRKSSKGSLYVADSKKGAVQSYMDHLACFAGGMFALGAKNRSDDWFRRGADITATCHKSYTITDTHIGPDGMHFDADIDAVALTMEHKKYMLRPETIESYFYMWRLTHNEKYRDWAWEAAQAFEKYLRTNNGYCGITNVYETNSPKDDVQQSFFLAETLKYLYLIFSEDTLLPLDRWVFNTEAHPFPIRHKVVLGKNIWPKSPSTRSPVYT